MTLLDVVMASVVDVIVMGAAGLLLMSGHQGWWRAYKDANSEIQRNAVEAMVAFGKIGRMSNKSDYVLYRVEDDAFVGPVLPSPSNPQEVVFGDAVEFRRWDVDLAALSEGQQKQIMKTDVTGNAYALFYLEEGALKVDCGSYPPGGVGSNGKKKNPTSTEVLARNVQSVRFSHTTRNAEGAGQGCIRMELTLHDPDRDTTVTVETATLMRNVWP